MSQNLISLVVEKKGTSRNKLTVALDRLVLKLTDGLTEKQEDWLQEFSIKADKLVRPTLKCTLRGRFELPNGYISLQEQNRKSINNISIHFSTLNMGPWPEELATT